MAETGNAGLPPRAEGPTEQELEERWKEAVDALTEHPRNLDLLLKAAQISEQLRRSPEAYTYYRKALILDPSKSFLVPKLRALALSAEQKDEVAAFSRRPASFGAALGDLPLYPVRGKGLAVLLLGSVFVWIGRALMKGGGGLSGVSLAGAATAYLAMFYIDVCHTTINGEDHLPDWPDPLRVNEVFSHVAKFFMPKIIAFLPVLVIVVAFGLGDSSSRVRTEIPDFRMGVAKPPVPPSPAPDPSDPAGAPEPQHPAPLPPPRGGLPWDLVAPVLALVAFIPLGLLYLPMATLSNVVMGSPWTCLNVPFVVRSILATPGNYLICAGLYLGTFGLWAGAEAGAALLGILPTGFALAFFELYGMTVLMRLLGLFYRMNQAKLGWLSD
ncbi:MAG TPA: hypothetical protein VKW04_23830 [Planctomycetota bacterium]|nr:hypothetical protein [Planctomycetota bacterium]